MTGMPRGQAYSARISELGGDDWFFDKVASGARMKAIAEEVGCSREWLYTWLKFAPDRKDRFREAQRIAAAIVFEDAGEIPAKLQAMKTAEITSGRVAAAKLQYEHEKSRAAHLDPDTFGDRVAEINVLNIGQLHLDALRKLGSMSLAKPEPLTLEGHTADDEDDGSGSPAPLPAA